MESLRDIKKRIRSVKNIEQITKAMEVVSMTKMRKSQSFALKARPFALASLELLHNLVQRSPTIPTLLMKRPIKNSLLVVVTADKGLVGSFNENVLRWAQGWLDEKVKRGGQYVLIAVGRKAQDYFDRENLPQRASFSGYGDYTSRDETLAIADLVLDGFVSGEWDEAEIVYTEFRTTLKQETVLRRVLPVGIEGLDEVVKNILPEKGRFADSIALEAKNRASYNYEYKFEPSPELILEALVPKLLRLHLHHVILESNASEHSARMVTMKNASDNAREVKGELNLAYNKVRQASITAELSEIIAASEALEQ